MRRIKLLQEFKTLFRLIIQYIYYMIRLNYMIRHLTNLGQVKFDDFVSSFTFCIDQTKNGINLDSYSSK